MITSKALSTVLQSSASKGLMRGLAAHMPCTSSPPSSSCSAVPSPHFGSVDTLRTGHDRRASAVAVDVSSAPSLPLLASKPLPMADLLANSTVLPALACTAEDYDFSADAVDALDLTPGNLVPFMRHSIGQETDSPYNAISDSWRWPLFPSIDCETLDDDSRTANCNCKSTCTCSTRHFFRTSSPLRFPSSYGPASGSEAAWAGWAQRARQQLVRSLICPQP